jgi:hypothetical protein
MQTTTLEVCIFTCLSPDVRASGLIAYWEPAFEHRPPHRLLANQLDELDHNSDDANQDGGNADNQNHDSFRLHA